MSKKVAAAPAGSGAGGRALWNDVLGKYELEEHELALLREAVRSVDQLDKLHTIVEAEGLVISGPNDVPRMHPAAVESRQLRIALARVIAALRLPADDATMHRPQRRVGVRGIYGVKGSG